MSIDPLEETYPCCVRVCSYLSLIHSGYC